jgi:hypothetical protein
MQVPIAAEIAAPITAKSLPEHDLMAVTVPPLRPCDHA